MNRKREILLTLGCVLAVSLTAAANLRSGGPLRLKLDNWVRARAVQRNLNQVWERLAASDDRLGSETGKVRAVVFLDFQCPVCAAEWPRLDSVLSSHPEIGVAVRNLPLSMIHPAAEGAARASICAGRQGKFAELANRFFTTTEWRSRRDWTREGELVGVPDLPAYRQCMNASSTVKRLTDDSSFAYQLGVHGTPTFVSQQAVMPGIMSRAQLENLLLSKADSGQ